MTDAASNIASQYDHDFEVFEDASAEARRIAALMGLKQAQGEYPQHQRAAVDELLRRVQSDSEFFLLNVAGGGTSPERLLTDGGRHGMDGGGLPRSDAHDLAVALTARNRSRDDLIRNWDRLSPSEQGTRRHPTGVPSA